MKNKLLLMALLLILGLSACKKQIEEFTFKGQFINGTTMNPTGINSNLTITAQDRNGKFLHEIRKFKSDGQGKFEFKYKRQKGNSITLELGFGGKIDNLPINQNFEKDPWYFSDKGTLELTLSTDNLLSDNNDTFYLYQFINNKQIIDTFTSIPKTHIVNFRYDPGEFGFYYGRNSTGFVYDNLNKYVIKAKQIGGKIGGDPIVNKATINY